MDAATGGRPASPSHGNQRSAARRAQLLDAADVVIRDKGPAASMDDIAAVGGVTKPIVYRHFGDKSGLYRVLAERYAESLLARLREALAAADEPRERLAGTLETYLEFIEDHRQVYRFLLYGDPSAQAGSRAVQSAFVSRFAEEIAALFAAGVDDASRAGAAQAWGHGIVGMVQLAGDWWLDAEPMSRGELVDQLCTLLWSGLSAAPEVFGREHP